MTYTFRKVARPEFEAYIQEIRDKLKEVAPEWEVETRVMENKEFYFLNRFDFSKGKNQTWPVTLNSAIFAYIVFFGNQDPEYNLMNISPIGDK